MLPGNRDCATVLEFEKVRVVLSGETSRLSVPSGSSVTAPCGTTAVYATCMALVESAGTSTVCCTGKAP
jgi:hypothetical protein